MQLFYKIPDENHFEYKLKYVDQNWFRILASFIVFNQTSMSVQVLNQTSVTLTLYAPTLKDPTFVAVKEDTRGMEETVQVSEFLHWE